jgi:hypothetical protein
MNNPLVVTLDTVREDFFHGPLLDAYREEGSSKLVFAQPWRR